MGGRAVDDYGQSRDTRIDDLDRGACHLRNSGSDVHLEGVRDIVHHRAVVQDGRADQGEDKEVEVSSAGVVAVSTATSASVAGVMGQLAVLAVLIVILAGMWLAWHDKL